MGRPRGARNPDYNIARTQLIAKLARRLQSPGGATSSFRELAQSADVSVATLTHYFGDRAGAITAVLENAHEQGKPYLTQVAHGPLSSLRESLAWFLDLVHMGLVEGGGAPLHELGLAAGFRHRTLGPAYLDHVLEPTAQALETRLARHLAAGDLVPCDLRVAATQLLAPVLVVVLHQNALGGTKCRPLNIVGFLQIHLETFLRTYEVPRDTPPRRVALVPLSKKRPAPPRRAGRARPARRASAT